MVSVSAQPIDWPMDRSFTSRRATVPRRAFARLVIVALSLVVLGLGRPHLEAQQARKIKVAFLYSDGNLPATLKAYKALLKERPELKDQVTFTFLTESMFDDVKPQDLASANALVFDVMNEQMLQ